MDNTCHHGVLIFCACLDLNFLVSKFSQDNSSFFFNGSKVHYGEWAHETKRATIGTPVTKSPAREIVTFGAYAVHFMRVHSS